MTDQPPPPEEQEEPQPEAQDHAPQDGQSQDGDDGAAPAAEQQFAYGPMIRKLAYLGMATVAIFYLVWWVGVYFMQDQIVYPRQQLPQLKETPVPSEIVQFRQPIEGGEVVAWFIPAQLSGGVTQAPAVIYFHDSADIIDNQSHIAHGYHRLGVGVLMPEYRGFGRSGGTPSQEKIRQDMALFHEQLVARADVDASRIIYHGVGLGGAVAADLASVKPPLALVLESTFKSGKAYLADMAVPGFLVQNPYDTEQFLRDFQRPVIIYHARHDEQTPIEHARALDKAAPTSKLFEFDNQLPGFVGLTKDPQFWPSHARLLASVGLIQPPRPPVPPGPPVPATAPTSAPATAPPG